MKFILTILAATTALASSPATAQAAENYTGFYAGGRLGYAFDRDNGGETVRFDSDLDGAFGDTINTALGANAFSPGFCGGEPDTAIAADGCDKDEGGIDYAVHAGFDYDFGGLVAGGLVEYGRSDIEDTVTAFSVTPANYALTREMKGTLGLRARVGFNAGGYLPYVTAGVVRAKIKSSFSTTNAVNAFSTDNRSNNEWGYRVGAGIERRFGNVAVGAQYLYTRVKDDEFRVNVTQGSAPATNPFVLVNPAGTQFRRSDRALSNHALGLTASLRF